jgi:hypothetical protein
MGQVRWASWTMAVATALLTIGAQVARADIASDKPAAIVLYPDVKVSGTQGVDTVIRLTNTNAANSVEVHCFYLDANSHCVGGTSEGDICTSGLTAGPVVCGPGACLPGWQEIDFDIVLTPSQPIQWRASTGLSDASLPINSGVCLQNQFVRCNSDNDCNPFPGGKCAPSNAGTRIPGVPEDPFVGELKCIEVNPNTGNPTASNDVKGEALIETSTATNLDVASYNALGIEAILHCQGGGLDGGLCKSNSDCAGGQCKGPDDLGTTLTLGGEGAEYNGCPNFLILNHFFDNAKDPVPGSNNTITTNLILVPCSEDLLRQIPGSAVVQYLVFNEFEQRLSTSNTTTCFSDTQLCRIDKGQCERSIFNVGIQGTLTGQTRMNPLGIPPLPSGLLGVAVETHTTGGVPRSAAFNLHMQGVRNDKDGNPLSDTVTIP